MGKTRPVMGPWMLKILETTVQVSESPKNHPKLLEIFNLYFKNAQKCMKQTCELLLSQFLFIVDA